GGPSGTYDFHRVALHEFGHVLGLDHPDRHGQTVVAIMNSIISDLDQLADDDIAGVRSLYSARITNNLFPANVNAGASFSYQITASLPASSFGVDQLPPGLILNATTGLISGVPTAVGNFNVTVTAHTSAGDASATIVISVIAPGITSSLFPPPVPFGDTFT